MHDPATELMRAFVRAIRENEVMADHLAALADCSDARGNSEHGDALAADARAHRVQAILVRAQLGALIEEYGALHLD